MGKKRLATQEGGSRGAGGASSKSPKRHIESAVLHVDSSYNNTRLTLSDPKGNVLTWASSGNLGFSGARKGTPFAAAKVGETVGDRAQTMGVKEVQVIVRGIGSGRESSIRGFISRGIGISTIKDMTPVPHNGPRPPRPRRV
ncbi:MAG TPA: 30S ribosomal protein S11 [Candidatus Paceibacterota bacterium]